jgi:hypothetical protein
MLTVIRTITSDTAQATTHLLSGVFLLSGFNVCIAAGALVTGAVIHDIPGGLENFNAVMSFSGTGLIEPIPQMVATLNWTTLGAMVIFAAYSFSLYVAEASRRSKPTATVVQFPTPSVVSESSDPSKKVANL